MKKLTTHTLTALAAFLSILFLTVSPAFAEEGSSNASTAPAGLGVLILVMGLAAIFLVGLYYLSQNRPPRAADTDDEDEDDE